MNVPGLNMAISFVNRALERPDIADAVRFDAGVLTRPEGSPLPQLGNRLPVSNSRTAPAVRTASAIAQGVKEALDLPEFNVLVAADAESDSGRA